MSQTSRRVAASPPISSLTLPSPYAVLVPTGCPYAGAFLNDLGGEVGGPASRLEKGFRLSSRQREVGGGRGGGPGAEKRQLAGSQPPAGLDPPPPGWGALRLKKGPALPRPSSRPLPRTSSISCILRSFFSIVRRACTFFSSNILPGRPCKPKGGDTATPRPGMGENGENSGA